MIEEADAIEPEVIEPVVEDNSDAKPEPKSLRDDIKSTLKDIKERDNAEKTESNTKEVVEKREKRQLPSLNVPAGIKPAGEKPAEKPLDPPISWRKEAKDKFALAPREVQEEALRRDKEAEQKISTMDEERRFAKSMKEVINPYTPLINSANSTPEKAVGEMLNYAQILQYGTPQAKGLLLNQLATRWGADMRFTPQAAAQPQNQIAVLQAELEKTKKELAGLPDSLKQQQESAQLKSVVDAFASDPKNVHYEKVRPVMAALLTAGNATDMKDAYDRACRADPEIHSLLAKEEAKRIADEKKAKADKARLAASSVKGYPGAIVQDTALKPVRSLKEELRANYRAATNQ